MAIATKATAENSAARAAAPPATAAIADLAAAIVDRVIAAALAPAAVDAVEARADPADLDPADLDPADRLVAGAVAEDRAPTTSNQTRAVRVIQHPSSHARNKRNEDDSKCVVLVSFFQTT
jgi:hypothetical protein